ncbi:MAG: hypothetical protein IPK27_17945 [Rhodanobacteraceae bacterium]|nr:hypothetical protein [Rhodanobacteraceae bacterium]
MNLGNGRLDLRLVREHDNPPGEALVALSAGALSQGALDESRNTPETRKRAICLPFAFDSL